MRDIHDGWMDRKCGGLEGWIINGGIKMDRWMGE